jgi:truncated hemoglobin YjbI
MPTTAAMPSESDIANLMHLFYMKLESDHGLAPSFAPVYRDRVAQNDTQLMADRYRSLGRSRQ